MTSYDPHYSVKALTFENVGVEMILSVFVFSGHMLSSFGDVLFVLMLMLVGKGYTITRYVAVKGAG